MQGLWDGEGMSDDECTAHPDPGQPHCLHAVDDDDTSEVCCWCGDLFLGAGPRGEHGPFRPPRVGDTYLSPDGSCTWRVISLDGAIGLTGPGPCRSIKYIEPKVLVNEWKRQP